uniref:dyslexia-associated protein KIAA0319-like protein homolog isoform X2 n=1 Tax=Myxine glutinosa TaxID=7769 RepID=UPI00358E6D03
MDRLVRSGLFILEFSVIVVMLSLFAPGHGTPLCQIHEQHLGVALLNTSHDSTLVLEDAHTWERCQEECCLRSACNVAWMNGGLCYVTRCHQVTDCHFMPAEQASKVAIVADRMYYNIDWPKERTMLKTDRMARNMNTSSEVQFADSQAPSITNEVNVPVNGSNVQVMDHMPVNVAGGNDNHSVIHGGKVLNGSLEARGSLVMSSPSALISTLAVPTVHAQELVVSAGENVVLTLPKNEVELNAFTIPELDKASAYMYEWKLMDGPLGFKGEMENNNHLQSLKLTKLSVGIYQFRVAVSGDNKRGEAFVNVTVKPVPRVNQPPVAIATPETQELSLPNSSAYIDGKESYDDDHVVSYNWEKIKGPLLGNKAFADTSTLHLSNLVPGNYTFRLTVVDSDGMSNSTTANVTVSKAVDYPPTANAGPNQEITLPQNAIILNGNQSSDDHGIVSFEWALSLKTKSKVLDMQGVQTPYVQLSAMKEGDYTFQLTVTDVAGQHDTAEVTVMVQPENNAAPQAVAGPDKELTYPVDGTTLDGSHSSDDQNIVSYHWERISGPSEVHLENADNAVATVSGLKTGSYVFMLTVRDDHRLLSTDKVTVTVKEESNQLPSANAGGHKVLVLPNSTTVLDGSHSTDDQGIVSYLWSRDLSSPAAGEVVNGSNKLPVLLVTNLVEGSYIFHLKVTDSSGKSNEDSATVEVKADPRGNEMVELVLDVPVQRLTEQQKALLIRQLSVMIGVLDTDVHIQTIRRFSQTSTQLIFYVPEETPNKIFKGTDVARTLQHLLQKEKADFLAYRVLRVDTFLCQLQCSAHGSCNSFSKRCSCHPFWMENFVRVYFGDGESNCDWSVLYATLTSFLVLVSLALLAWLVLCCCHKMKKQTRRRVRYTVLSTEEDAEAMEMQSSHRGPKKPRPIQANSIMMSDSDLDSDQETLFSRNGLERKKLLVQPNGSVPNAVNAKKVEAELVL